MKEVNKKLCIGCSLLSVFIFIVYLSIIYKENYMHNPYLFQIIPGTSSVVMIAVRFIMLAVFSVLAVKVSYINPRIYLVSILCIYILNTILYIAMPEKFMPLSICFEKFFEMYPFITAFIIGVRIFLIPVLLSAKNSICINIFPKIMIILFIIASLRMICYPCYSDILSITFITGCFSEILFDLSIVLFVSEYITEKNRILILNAKQPESCKTEKLILDYG